MCEEGIRSCPDVSVCAPAGVDAWCSERQESTSTVNKRHAGEGAPLACVSTRAVKDVSHRSRRGASKMRGVVTEPCRSLEHFEVPRIMTSLHSSHTSSVHSMCCSCKSCQKDRSVAKAESRQIFWPHAHFQEPRGETLRHVLSQFNRTTQHVIKWLCVWPCSCACVVLFEYTGRDKDGIKDTDKEKSDRWTQTHNKERKTQTSADVSGVTEGPAEQINHPKKCLKSMKQGVAQLTRPKVLSRATNCVTVVAFVTSPLPQFTHDKAFNAYTIHRQMPRVYNS